MIARLRAWVVGADVGTLRYWVALIVPVSRLGDRRRDSVWLLALGAILPIRDWLLPRRRRWPLVVRIRFEGLVVRWALTSKSDLEVINEVLVLRVYDTATPAPPATILDLGSHIGVSLLFFRAVYPKARIVGVEADPLTYRLLERNVEQLSGVTVCRAAVAAVDGSTSFAAADQPWVSAITASTEASGACVVPARSIGCLVSETELGSIDLLKIDVEGTEGPALAAFDRLADVATIVGEFHGGADELAGFTALFGSREVTIAGGPGHYGFQAHPRPMPGAPGRRRTPPS